VHAEQRPNRARDLREGVIGIAGVLLLRIARLAWRIARTSSSHMGSAGPALRVSG